MTQYIEDTEPSVAYPGGFNTNKPATFGSTVSVTGVATFAAAPVFSGGQLNSIISGSGATVTLTGAQSGSTVLMDRAAGIVFTLPTPVVGRSFSFLVSTTVTSNSYKVITDAGTTFIAGSILASVDNTANKSWVGNGTTHLAVTQSSASTNATGGIVGSYIRFVCVSSTLWDVYGLTVAGGTPTTPFATS